MRLLVLLGVCVTLVGCRSGARISSSNDELRVERELQREQIETLEIENAELRTKLAEANARAETPLPEDVLDALPRVADIELTRFCSVEGGTVTWSIRPTDGRGRFVQVVGTLELRATSAGDEPRTLAEAVLTPAELREAYASGLAGTGYRVTRNTDFEGPGVVALTATLHDLVSGTTHTASRFANAR
ncbi:MAG: hypothetical protein AAFR76_12755 [Planctomycetota bacterium]